MLKIVILEDEKSQSDRLAGFLAQYQKEHPLFLYTLQTFDRSVCLLDTYRRDADLIFLDIRMPDIPGMDVARHIRKMDDKVMIVFVTGLAQYAVEGYSVGAFDYILKPVAYSSFSVKLERALRVLALRETKLMLDLRAKESSRRVAADSVIYIEVSAHDLLFHTIDETIKQWGTLSQYENLLRDAHFARPSAGFLVNLKYVQGIKKGTVLLGSSTVPLSRSKRKEFLIALAQYKGGSV